MLIQEGFKLIIVIFLAITFNINTGIDAHLALHHSYGHHVHSHGEGLHHHEGHSVENFDKKGLNKADHGHFKFSYDIYHNVQSRFDLDHTYAFEESKIKFDIFEIKLKSLIRIVDIHYVPPPGQFRNLPLLN